tara:strand:- start:830 stop:988 length:159 start_codon:yes stop_codon:yes gene_type:complete
MSDLREKIMEARKALHCLYIAVPESVARDVTAKIEPLLALIEGNTEGQDRLT